MESLMQRLSRGVLCLSFVSWSACTADDGANEDAGDDGDHDHDDIGVPSGAVCPPTGTELTYDDFARPFFESYCLRCHSSTVTGSDRNGAPDDHNFDTEFAVLTFAGHIDQYAAAGADSTNTVMPPSDPRPTLAEREQLGEWLACNADLDPDHRFE